MTNTFEIGDCPTIKKHKTEMDRNKLKNSLLREASKSCKHAIKAYFQPLKSYKELEELTAFPERIAYEKHLSAIKDCMCFNQGSIVQYFYIASEYHKELKEYLTKNELVNDQHVKILTDKLINYLNIKFEEFTHVNFELLHNYFQGRDKHSPRFCLKGNFKVDRTGEQVITVFRDTKVGYISDCEIEKNTGFWHIKNTGKHFLCNDIPKAAAEGKYLNPRLSKERVIAYKKQRVASNLVTLWVKRKNLSSWASCWKDYDRDQDRHSFYKSTLIIPMTLVNNVLDEDFILKIPNADKLIFGFLCIDHVKENYFKESDVTAGYIFADMISIYLFTRKLFTEISKTFSAVDHFLESPKSEDNISKLESYILKYHQTIKENTSCSSKKNNNYIYDLDDPLLQYIKK